ncbi:hypothetical protein HanIR_Chr09g0437781 [Helianthus annuus]|nr:hypothetical protein HanIR_Chr09g0437781 [Helianthus annuus]
MKFPLQCFKITTGTTWLLAAPDSVQGGVGGRDNIRKANLKMHGELFGHLMHIGSNHINSLFLEKGSCIIVVTSIQQNGVWLV